MLISSLGMVLTSPYTMVDVISISECYYSTTVAAYLISSAKMTKGGASNKSKQSMLKVGTRS